MTSTQAHTLTPATNTATANAARTRFSRESGPRRWWRALDRMTLETMNPPIPAHVRAAMGNHGTSFTEASDFAGAIRAAAPGRSNRRAGRSKAPEGTDFASNIRAGAPGRRDHR